MVVAKSENWTERSHWIPTKSPYSIYISEIVKCIDGSIHQKYKHYKIQEYLSVHQMEENSGHLQWIMCDEETNICYDKPLRLIEIDNIA